MTSSSAESVGGQTGTHLVMPKSFENISNLLCHYVYHLQLRDEDIPMSTDINTGTNMASNLGFRVVAWFWSTDLLNQRHPKTDFSTFPSQNWSYFAESKTTFPDYTVKA